MKILHINSNFLTSKLHENLLDGLNIENIEHTVFMPMKIETVKDIKFKSKYDVINPVSFKNIDKFFFSYKQRKIMKTLKKNITVYNYNLTHAHTLFTDGNVSYQLKKRYGIPYVVTVRGDTDIENFFKYRINLRNLGRNILANASKICFISPTHRNKLINKYIKDNILKEYILKNSIILANGIDNFWFDNEYRGRDMQVNEPIKIISVGLINHRKNQLTAIKAVNAFEKKYDKKAILTLVGKIEDANYYNKIKNAANNNLIMSGPVKQEKLITFYRENHIFLLPSKRETFGLVYPEAMSQGLPILYSKNQGIDGYFKNGAVGFNVESNSAEEIAKKINLVLNNYEVLSMNARIQYQQFNWDQITMNLTNLYKKILNGR